MILLPASALSIRLARGALLAAVLGLAVGAQAQSLPESLPETLPGGGAVDPALGEVAPLLPEAEAPGAPVAPVAETPVVEEPGAAGPQAAPGDAAGAPEQVEELAEAQMGAARDAEAAPAALQRPFPSPLEDPLGAVHWLLERPERVAGAPHDLSPWGMYRGADLVVKLVMLGLAFASLVTWTVWLAKSLELFGARRRLRRALGGILGAQSLEEALAGQGHRAGPAALMLRAAENERRRSAAALPHAGGEGLERRVSSALGQIEAAAGRRLARGTGLLATIGSTAPFVGLFGTVWGIMNAFVSIAESNTTNLAVVAPGIAEALLATAIGLVAAIPAVIIYNHFARAITGWRQQLAAAGAGIERLVSRDLDFALRPLPIEAAPAALPEAEAVAAAAAPGEATEG